MFRRATPAFVLLGLLIASSAFGRARRHGSRFAVFPENLENLPVHAYMNATSEQCLEALDERGFPYEMGEIKGHMETPIRIAGPVRGVEFRPTYRPDPGDELSPMTLLDCRLALGIDDLAAVLKSEGVVTAEYLSLYRPGRWMQAGRRHPSGLAIDLAKVWFEDGTSSEVEKDFSGRVGTETCGPDAVPPRRESMAAFFWRRVACRLAERGSFNLILTPNYNRGHRDHFHMEVRTGVRWVLVN